MAQQNILIGIGVGSVAVRAEVFRWQSRRPLPELLKSDHSPEFECDQINNAVRYLDHQYQAKIALADSQELKEILQAQQGLATDSEFSNLANEYSQAGWSANSAIQLAMGEFRTLLEGAGGEFGERIADLDEIVYRLVQWVDGLSDETSLPTSGKFIVVAQDLTPMDTITFTDVVAGVITESGGPTSHTAIVCRSRDIPALVACSESKVLKNGQMVMLDPENSQAIIDGELSHSQEIWWDFLSKSQISLIPVLANVGSVQDAKRSGEAQGVGLLRTELFFLKHSVTPTLLEQRDIYTKVLQHCPNGEIIIRTLDAGSDKPIAFLNLESEENPALGVRGQRVADLAPEFYQNQLLALIESGKIVVDSGKKIELSIMAPMIATVSEAKNFATSARAAGFTRVGIMIEIPAMAFLIPALKGIVDFISVGTNDLSQYLFAADRVNSRVAHLLNPWEPALLSILELIAKNSADAGIKTGVCGEAASDPLLAVVLAGLGFKSVSVSASAIDRVTDLLSRVSQESATSAAYAARSADNAKDAKEAARSILTTP